MKQNPFTIVFDDLYFHNRFFSGWDFGKYQQELLDFGVTHPDVNVRRYIAEKWCTPDAVRIALASDKDEGVLQALLECERTPESVLKILFGTPKFATIHRCFAFLRNPHTPIDIVRELCNHECDSVSEVAKIRLEAEEFYGGLVAKIRLEGEEYCCELIVDN